MSHDGDAVSPTPADTSPTVDEVARIAAIRNRVIRNLEITHCYWQLAQAMRARTVPAANWCTFATWASRQAGSTIRGEDLIANFRRKLGEKARLLAPLQSVNRLLLRKGMFEPDTRLGRVVAEVHTPFDAFERASEAVAQGNLKVFDEIGREFARSSPACVPARRRTGRTASGTRSPTTSSSGTKQTRPHAKRGCCLRTSRSGCTSRRGCSRRSPRRSMHRSRRRKTWERACCMHWCRRRGRGRAL
jgi:hypothetical protein